MRIEGKPGEPLSTAYLWLTRDEASELRDTLEIMLAQGPDPSWHSHVSAADYQTEVTIAWET